MWQWLCQSCYLPVGFESQSMSLTELQMQMFNSSHWQIVNCKIVKYNFRICFYAQHISYQSAKATVSLVIEE